ncbi:WavE lipopolysaccharide synthesis family protein [Vibrio sp. S4B1]|nr:WavE lipopolysaccharide synthesis family protein [Vibrio methylphosphonaticus]
MEHVTSTSISNIRKLFPNSYIIISTWNNAEVDNIAADRVILNNDPGPTIVEFDKKGNARTTNVNRQIVSTVAGLKAVRTKFAVKVRTDNIINGCDWLAHFDEYTQRNEEYSIFENRIIASSLYAKEVAKGISVPYFYSDFFHFGLTNDLLTLWDIDCLKEPFFNPRKLGKKQHKQAPNRLLHIEQILFLKCLNKFTKTKLMDEYGQRSDIKKSINLLVNNFIVLDSKELEIIVPARLNQVNTFPYKFSDHQRWLWLYEKAFNLPLTGSVKFRIKWWLARLFKLFHKGIRNTIKTTWIRRKTR